MFSDKDTNRARQAMVAVAKIGGERVVQALVGALGSASSFVRDAAQAELTKLNWQPPEEKDRILLALARQNRWPEPGELGKQAVGRLLELLADADRNIRDRAASTLGKLADPRATDALIHALADQDEMHRTVAVAALGELGDRRAVPPLIGLLAKVQGSFMAEALPEALGKLRDPRALIPLASAASAESDIAPFIAHAAVPAIEAILVASAKEATLDALHVLAALGDLAEKVDDHRSEFDTFAAPLSTASIRALARRELELRG